LRRESLGFHGLKFGDALEESLCFFSRPDTAEIGKLVSIIISPDYFALDCRLLRNHFDFPPIDDLGPGVGVEVEVGGRVGAAGELLEGQGADHGRVVRTELWGGHVGVEAGLPGEILKARPQSRVAGDTAAENERPGQGRIGGQAQVVHKGPGDDLLEAGQEIGQPRIVLADPSLADMLDRPCLEAAEAEIEAPVLRPRHGERERLGVAAAAELLDDRPARIA